MSGTTGRVIVIGGGAAGMAAACFAAEEGAQVTLLEKNEKLGKKLYITGKGRCNVTNAVEEEAFLTHVISNPRFLRSALHRFDSFALMRFLEEEGASLKVERGNRVFPVSDHASDITKTWEKALRRRGVDMFLQTEVAGLVCEEDGVTGVRLTDGRVLPAEAVIVATGGLSYPTTGSTGDGYRMAEETGHSVVPCRPSLVALVVQESWAGKLAGLSPRNCTLTIRGAGKKPFREFGEFLFTQDGISGPLALSASAVIGATLENGPCPAEIDWKPALSEEQVDAKLLRIFSEAPNKSLRNVLRSLLPASLCAVFPEVLGLSGDMAVHEIRKEQRRTLREGLKHFPLTIIGTHDYREAVITQGGIATTDVDPKTMGSRRCNGLYFAGEVLDLDATTGGFNLQIAWATGHAAGRAAAVFANERS